LKIVHGFPDNFDRDDMEEATAACSRMPAVSGDAFEQLVGNWKVEWNSRSGRVWPTGEGSCTPLPLKLRAHGVLPPVPVQFTGMYNRVLDVRKNSFQPPGGIFELIDVFTIPRSEGIEAALVLAGPWKTGSSEGEWGKGAPRTRCGLHLQTARLALSSSDPGASKAMLEAAGLGEFLQPVDISTSATYIDLDFISKSARVHKDESGVMHVLTRLSDPVPFSLD